ELLITLVILGILVAIAVPNYTGRVIKASRSDATGALLALAAAQEKFYLKNNAYTDTLADLGITTTAEKKYDLAITLPGAGGFVATATPADESPQLADSDCQSFSIDHTGRKLATDGDSGDTTGKCW
ncbi:MAG: hypothetical protein HKN70_10075, partial [Gammaproteobacteria bacterium]|nr:hypothetical protein [Gammaproteobacteria bacterium]